MSEAASGQLTRTLDKVAGGDPAAAADLLPLVYEELRLLARSRLAGAPPGTTIQPTALVHDAYLRIVGDRDPGWNGRGHFFGAAARAMRNILVDRARYKSAKKRGGDARRVELDLAELAIEEPQEDMLALDKALTDLEHADPRKAQVVMLHYFAGLTMKEVAEVIGVSVPTVERDWRFTRAFLFTQLSDNERAEQE